MRRNGRFRARCSIKGTASEAINEGVINFREYAEGCRRLTTSIKPEHKATLLEIEDAWDEVAEEAERGGGTNERGKRQ
jgi:hypothetical protein